MHKILDIHTHPGLKNWLFPHLNHLYKKGIPANDTFNNCVNQIDMPSLIQGQFGGLVSAHYLPEKSLFTDGFGTKLFRLIAPHFVTHQYPAFESDDSYTQVNSMMDKLEIEIATTKSRGFDVELIQNLEQLNKAWPDVLNNGKIIFIHSLEGGHCLGRNLKTEADYIERLNHFKNRGVCMLTLAHFFENDLAFGVEGIAPSFRKLVLSKRFVPNNNALLKPIGEAIVREMLKSGIIIDLTHLTIPARNRVYELNKEVSNNKRPLVFSHTGVHGKFKPIPQDSTYKFDLYTALDSDIEAISKCNGVVGIIMENYWLSGIEESTNNPSSSIGIPLVLETIDYIFKKTGSYNNISIGSDFDGYIDAPKDLIDASTMGKLIEAMKGHGIGESNIEAICWGNAMRVLKDGWN